MPPERRRKACRECRAQKIRCDAEPPATCSRCRRMSLTCVLSSNPNARQTKAQLQKEIERLKDKDVPGSHLSPAAISSLSDTPSVIQAFSKGKARRESEVVPNSAVTFSISPPASNDFSTLANEDERCSSRTCNGHDFEAHKIRDCFALFFANYQPMLPILDPLLSPNEYYELSPFLFWTIVFIGSRRYARDPTLLGRLASHINSMALLSLHSRANPIQTIQGLLLLCVWPIPMNTMHKDVSHVLSGAAMHLATQIGLHVVGTGQDFARTKLESNHSQKVFRSQLWVQCILTCHDTSLREGIAPLIPANSSTIGLDDDELFVEFPEQLRTRRRLHDIMMGATVAMLRTLHDKSTMAQPNALSPFISLFDAQFLDLLTQCQSKIDLIYLSCCRVHLLAYYFLERSDVPNRAGLIRLYSVAISLIDMLNGDDNRDFVEHSPIFVERTVSIAAFSVLKIHRSPLGPHVDLAAGEAAFFAAMFFSRKCSLQNDDIGARCVTIWSQLWTSKNAFKLPSGQIDSLRTRIRSRLSMSIVFDCFWYWREEFAGQPNPYKDEAESAVKEAHPGPFAEAALPVDPTIADPHTSSPFPVADSIDSLILLPEDQPFPDYDWAANIDLADINWATNLDAFAGAL
ncbi:hypothetical protein GQ53DRAFT_751127 [Thozetella sp. PMI_491]|nr:hypothetical protein GQ53DRAFT_751127 [Thozetella sp. PMI_491]